ncbi:sensor histidine kinase [Treponema sp.]|uniref:sensor histidine kinase n=1 Tax=Treponema sp. TaxID=166 RepID=UPI00298DF32F|nr:histidine kinase [Treponema sp.]MCQ2240366.1 histidine kinase [Treponema sp.]
MKKIFLVTLLSLFSSLCFAQFTEVLDSYFYMLEQLENGKDFEEASNNLNKNIMQLHDSKIYLIIKNQHPELNESLSEIRNGLDAQDANAISKGIKHYAFELISIQNSVQRNTNFFIILFSAFIFATIFIIALYFSKEYQTRESKKIITEVYKGVDEERMRIARELHDTVAQELLGTSIKIESIDRTNEEDINDLSNKIRETITEIRNVCYNLNPPAFIDESDFEIALAELCHNFELNSGIKCQFSIDGENLFKGTDENTKLNIFRIVSEALSNIQKHSLADTATVNFRKNGTKGTAFFISDDGIGFDARKITSTLLKLQSGKHFGLGGIFQRAKIIGGKMEIFSEPDNGCTIKVTF